MENWNTGIKSLYGKLSVRVRALILNSDTNVQILYAESEHSCPILAAILYKTLRNDFFVPSG